MSPPCLAGQPQAAAARLHPRQAGSPDRAVFVEVTVRRIAGGLLPAALEPTVALDPMTSQRRSWNPALALLAAKTRKVVIGMGNIRKPGPAQRDAPRLVRPESSKCEACKSRFCERFEHRSPPLPRFARQVGERTVS